MPIILKRLKDLFSEMRAVARGEIPAPEDAATPSREPNEASRAAIMEEKKMIGDQQSIHNEVGRRMEEERPGEVIWIDCDGFRLPTYRPVTISTGAIVVGTISTSAIVAGTVSLDGLFCR